MKVSVIKKPADFVKQSRPEDIMNHISLEDAVKDTNGKDDEALDFSDLDLD